MSARLANQMKAHTPHMTPRTAAGLLQRKCDCGQHTVAGGACDSCSEDQRTLQRAASNPETENRRDGSVPTIVDEVLRSPGQPLDANTRAFMEPRFAHNFTGTPMHVNTSVPIPARLSIGSAHDEFERDAEATARDVMSRSDTSTATKYDFSGVRIHADAGAAASARAVNALAYTVGRHIVFGQGQYQPHTGAGSKLLAHELTHVLQQSNAGEYGAAHSGNERPLLSGPSRSGVLARQTDPGWNSEKGLNKGATTVDDKGQIVSGKVESTKGKGVWRVPIQGLHLGKGDKARAIALIPNTISSASAGKSENVAVDVLLHLHGYGAGYLELKPGETDYAGVLKPGQLRDVELYKMEQQLLSLSGTRLVIAVLPQGSDRSDFEDLGSRSDAYIKEVFDKLVAFKYISQAIVPGQVIVSGHSGGGPTTMAIANQRKGLSKRTDVLLFDAINSGCVEKVAVIKDGKPVLNPDGSPKMRCKKCKSYEFNTVRDWVTDRITADIKSLAGIDPAQRSNKLKTDGTRFRGRTSSPMPNDYTCSYGYWYGELKKHIDTTIDKPKFDADAQVDSQLKKQLHENYNVEPAMGLASIKDSNEWHERVMGQGNLEAVLKK